MPKLIQHKLYFYFLFPKKKMPEFLMIVLACMTKEKRKIRGNINLLGLKYILVEDYDHIGKSINSDRFEQGNKKDLEPTQRKKLKA